MLYIAPLYNMGASGNAEGQELPQHVASWPVGNVLFLARSRHEAAHRAAVFIPVWKAPVQLNGRGIEWIAVD